jgi:hypothetical protein
LSSSLGSKAIKDQAYLRERPGRTACCDREMFTPLGACRRHEFGNLGGAERFQKETCIGGSKMRAVLISLALSLALAACGGDERPVVVNPAPSQTVVVPSNQRQPVVVPPSSGSTVVVPQQ